MEVTRENVDNLTALIKVKVAAEDYQPKVDKALENYRKQANIPGFRKGKVPMGMIKKQYGKALLAEELNKLVNDALFNHIESEKIEILGNPIPKEDANDVGDFENPSTFEFTYEIGLTPEVEVKLSGRNKYEYTKVKIDDQLVGQQIDDLRRRYGKLVSAESVAEKSLVLGQFVELNEDETIKEGGVLHSSTISMEFVTDESTKAGLMDKKVGETLVLDPIHVSRGGKDTAAMLGVKEEELSSLSNKFQFKVNEVKQMELAELNQELFDKLFGAGEVNSEEEMRAKVVADLEGMFEKDSDRILTRRITNDLIEKTEIALPDAFLKRWIQVSQKEPIAMEVIESEYEGYAKGLKWQMIQNAIFKSNDLKIERQEAIDFTKSLLVNQYAQYGIPAPEDEELTKSATQVLSNKEEAQRISDMLVEEKLMTYFKNTVKLAEKEVAYEEFVKIAQDVNA